MRQAVNTLRGGVATALVAAATAFGVTACSGGSSGHPASGAGGGGGAPNVGGPGGGGTGAFATDNAFPNGIGTDWKWKTGTVAHTGGPYAPCGIVGTGRITFGAASPVDSEFAAASRAGVVLFYSVATGKQVRAPYYAAGPVNSVDYTRDGSKLVVAGDTGVQIVRLADRNVLYNGRPFALSTRAAALSPDGSMVAAVGWDDTNDINTFTLKLVRVNDGTLLETSSALAPDGVAPQFSPDGKLLVAGGMIFSIPGLVVIPPAPLAFSHVSPHHAVLSPDGTMVGEGGHVIHLASGREVKAPIEGQELLYWSAFSRDGTIYAETDNRAIYLWRTSDWGAIGAPTPIAFTSTSGSDGADGRFFLSGDGEHLIATVRGSKGGDQAVFQIMNLPDLTAGPTVAEPGLGWSPALLSPDGALLMSTSGNSADVWQMSDLSPLARLPETSAPYGFLGNGMLQVDQWVFNPRDGTRLGRSDWSAISPDGRLAVMLLAGLKTSVIRVADLSTQAAIDASALLGPVWKFSRDGRFLVGAGKNPNGGPEVVVFDAVTGTRVASLAGLPPVAISTTAGGTVRVAAFVPSSSTFPSDVRVWSVPDRTPLFDIKEATAKDWPASGDLATMDFSPDGSLIAAGATNIRIFRADTGVLRETLPAHFDAQPGSRYSGVLSLSFSATGQIVSVGWDSTMRIWCSP